MSLEAFDTTTVIILDYRRPAEADSDDDNYDHDETDTYLSPHDKKNEALKNFFEAYTYAKVICVEIPASKSVNKAIIEVKRVVKGLTGQDNTIVYFGGSTGFSGSNWRWKFENNLNGWFNAYKLIRVLAKSAAHTSLIVDGRLSIKNSGEAKRLYGSIEIFGPATQDTDPDGKPTGLKYDYTICMIRALKGYIRNINSTHKASTTPTTIPQVLGRHKDMRTNTLRVEPKSGKGLLINPTQVRESVKNGEKKIRFYRYTSEPDQSTAASQPTNPTPRQEFTRSSGAIQPSSSISRPLRIYRRLADIKRSREP